MIGHFNELCTRISACSAFSTPSITKIVLKRCLDKNTINITVVSRVHKILFSLSLSLFRFLFLFLSLLFRSLSPSSSFLKKNYFFSINILTFAVRRQWKFTHIFTHTQKQKQNKNITSSMFELHQSHFITYLYYFSPRVDNKWSVLVKQ